MLYEVITHPAAALSLRAHLIALEAEGRVKVGSDTGDEAWDAAVWSRLRRDG